MTGAIVNFPDYRLVVDGKDLTPTLSGFIEQGQERRRPRLTSLTLTEQRSETADQLDLILDDSDGQLALPRIGARLQLQLGWKGGRDVKAGLVDKGSFIVDSVEHSGPPGHPDDPRQLGRLHRRPHHRASRAGTARRSAPS